MNFQLAWIFSRPPPVNVTALVNVFAESVEDLVSKLIFFETLICSITFCYIVCSWFSSTIESWQSLVPKYLFRSSIMRTSNQFRTKNVMDSSQPEVFWGTSFYNSDFKFEFFGLLNSKSSAVTSWLSKSFLGRITLKFSHSLFLIL